MVLMRTHWLYAGPSCTICQFWLFAGQCKSIDDQRKLLYTFGSKKWQFAWLMSSLVGIKVRTRLIVNIRG